MSILKHLLVPIDGSEASAPAVDYALRLAQGEGAELTFCNAVDITGTIAECSSPYVATDLTPILNALEDECKALVHAAQQKAKALGVTAHGFELAGPPAGAIAEAAHERGVSAIVMGSHGRHGASRLFLGSTAEGVLRRTDIPVLIVSQAERALPADPLSRILVAIDDSDPADAALEFALSLAHPKATTIVLLHVLHLQTLHQMANAQRYAVKDAFAEEKADARKLLSAAAERTTACGIATEVRLFEGAPVEEILKLARTERASLIVIGTHGRRGIRRLFLGSVAEEVAREAPVPVAVVRRRMVAPSVTEHQKHAAQPQLVPS